ncbi:unnamed protein product [Symbiodinium necroappetens]|uniref:Uncharacterized protein n=1 Tax=Symbiodinium necroappetens TaxID=1628268 RepID=A0A812Z7A6_9DINO|nr:unnamed protein product [Symbiodinium necroappetens]
MFSAVPRGPGLQRIYNSTSSRLAELERALDLKEKEREAALEKERLMAVKYKELDIFKLDIIARELKALDNELGRVGSGVKSLSQDSSRLRNYDEQQMVSQHSNNLLDQCKLLRAHIRDVINKCLSETQKMQLGMWSTAMFCEAGNSKIRCSDSKLGRAMAACARAPAQ